MKKSYGFFAKTAKEQKEKAGKLKKIVSKLSDASKQLSKDISKTSSKDKKEQKKRELQVVNKLYRKASKRLHKLTKNDEQGVP